MANLMGLFLNTVRHRFQEPTFEKSLLSFWTAALTFKSPSARFSSPDNFRPEKVFYVCGVCTEAQNFNNFENDTILVKEAGIIDGFVSWQLC